MSTALLDSNAVRLSHHATVRAVEMNMTPSDIATLIKSPETVVEPGAKSKYYKTGRYLHNAGDYTAVVEHSPGILSVVTFLWRRLDGWEKSYADDASTGRERRANPFAPKEKQP